MSGQDYRRLRQEDEGEEPEDECPDCGCARCVCEDERDPCEECGRPVLFRGEILCPMCFELNGYIDGTEQHET